MGWWPGSKVAVGTAKKGVGLIRNGHFAKLWGSQILSQIAQNLLNFALVIRVFELAQHTRFANISVALLILSFGVPSIFFAAAAGVYVDHWNRKHVLVVANLLRAVLVLGYLMFEHNLIIVLLLSFLISSITQFFAPAEAASIPALVGEEKLLRANSLFIFTLYASFIVGYSASAPVIAAFGAAGPYYLTAVMFLVAGVLVGGLPSIQAKTKHRVAFSSVIRTTGSEILRNWNTIRTNHNLLFPILQLTITQATLGVILALAPAISLEVLGRPIQSSSHVLIIPAGIGMVLGVLLLGRLARFGKMRLISLALIAAAVALSGLGLVGLIRAHHIDILVAAGILLLGFMNAVVSAASQTLMQEHTTDETRGKVFGALNMMINIAATAPIFFAGILADFFGVSVVVTSIGTALLLYAVFQWYRLRRRQLV